MPDHSSFPISLHIPREFVLTCSPQPDGTMRLDISSAGRHAPHNDRKAVNSTDREPMIGADGTADADTFPAWFNPELYFFNAKDDVIDCLSHLYTTRMQKSQALTVPEVLMAIVENDGERNYQAELDRCHLSSRAAVTKFSKSLKKRPLKRGPYTMRVVIRDPLRPDDRSRPKTHIVLERNASSDHAASQPAVNPPLAEAKRSESSNPIILPHAHADEPQGVGRPQPFPLAACRHGRNLTVAQAARKAGISSIAWSNSERGHTKPSSKTVQGMARVLGVSGETVVGLAKTTRQMSQRGMLGDELAG